MDKAKNDGAKGLKLPSTGLRPDWIECDERVYVPREDLAEATCTFTPDLEATEWDEDGNEVDTGEQETIKPHEDCESFSCSNCGRSMFYGENGWFELDAPHTPKFSYCPYCGAKVIKEES